MIALKEKLKKQIDVLDSSQVLELHRIIKFFNPSIKKNKKSNLILRAYSCGKKKLNFNRCDAYDDKI